MIATEKILRLTGYVSSQQGTPFQWGRLDCNIFVAVCNDILTGKKTVQNIAGKYSDYRSAVRFQETYLSARQYLHMNGWRETDDEEIRDGDALLVDDTHFTRAHIVLNGNVWSVHEEYGLCGANIEAMPPFTHWRLK
jgi:hypothetical protein